MISSIQSKLGFSREENKRCYFLFPSSAGMLPDFLAAHIQATLCLECTPIQYTDITRAAVCDFADKLRKSCILIIGYDGNIRDCIFYKLGLAHALSCQVILVNLRLLSSLRQAELPNFIQYDFIILCKASESNPVNYMAKQIEVLIDSLANNELDSIFYNKALEVCHFTEGIMEKSFEKVSKAEFIRRINKKSIRETIVFLRSNRDETRLNAILHHALLADKGIKFQLALSEALSCKEIDKDKSITPENYLLQLFTGDIVIGEKSESKSQLIQNNFDQAKGFQTKAGDKSSVYQAEEINKSTQKQALEVEALRKFIEEVKILLIQLVKDNPLATEDEKAEHIRKALPPSRLQRVVEIVQAGGEALIEEIPGGKAVVAVLKKVREQEANINKTQDS